MNSDSFHVLSFSRLTRLTQIENYRRSYFVEAGSAASRKVRDVVGRSWKRMKKKKKEKERKKERTKERMKERKKGRKEGRKEGKKKGGKEGK